MVVAANLGKQVVPVLLPSSAKVGKEGLDYQLIVAYRGHQR